MHCSTSVSLPSISPSRRAGLASCTVNCSWCYSFSQQDFYQKECWAHHPKPHQEYIDMRKKQVSKGSRPRVIACRLQ